MSGAKGRPRPWPPAIGMPGWLYLNAFGEMVEAFFGETAYLVGSASNAKGTEYRDVDVRVMLPDARYLVDGYLHIGGAPFGTKWGAVCMAFAALGEKMTGLPIDFQVQSMTEDCEKQNLCVLEGWRYLRVTPSQIDSGKALEWVERALARRRAA